MQPRAGEQRPGSEQDLRPVVGGHRPQPVGLSTVHPAGQPGVDQHEPQRPHVDRAVRAGLDRVLGVGVAVPAGSGELLGGGGGRAPPEHAAHRPRPHGAGRGGQRRAGVGRGVAEDGHEAGEAVVPVGGAGDAEDRGGVVGIRREQALLVGPQAPCGCAGVPARDGEVGVACGGQQDRLDGVLDPASRARVAEDGDRRAVEPGEAVDDPVGRRARHALGAGPLVEAAQPEQAGFLRRITEQAREQGVTGGERGTAAPATRCRAGGRAAPARGLGRGPGRRARRRGRIGGRRGPLLPGPRPQPHGAHRGRFTTSGAASAREDHPLSPDSSAITRLSGVHRRRGRRATSHDRQPRPRVPEVRDRPDGREDS